jgi:hypothetical protein
MDDVYVIIVIFLCIFGFLLVLLGMGSFYGGDMNTIAQGVSKFILLITGFAFGCFVLWRLLKK